MLQVLKIGSCLEIFIVCLHLALSNLEVPSFLFSVSMEKAMGEWEKAGEKLEQDI